MIKVTKFETPWRCSGNREHSKRNRNSMRYWGKVTGLILAKLKKPDVGVIFENESLCWYEVYATVTVTTNKKLLLPLPFFTLRRNRRLTLILSRCCWDYSWTNEGCVLFCFWYFFEAVTVMVTKNGHKSLSIQSQASVIVTTDIENYCYRYRFMQLLRGNWRLMLIDGPSSSINLLFLEVTAILLVMVKVQTGSKWGPRRSTKSRENSNAPPWFQIFGSKAEKFPNTPPFEKFFWAPSITTLEFAFEFK